jgi:hypothetical protein
MTRQQRRAAERATAKAWVTVISTPGLLRHEGVNLMVPPEIPFAEGNDCTYFFYKSRGAAFNKSFNDLDGGPMIEAHSFDTLDQAKAWVTKDAHQRWQMLCAVGRAQ